MLRITAIAALLCLAAGSLRGYSSTEQFVDSVLLEKLKPELQQAHLDPAALPNKVVAVYSTPFYGGPVNASLTFFNGTLRGLKTAVRPGACSAPRTTIQGNATFNCTLYFTDIHVFYSVNITRNYTSVADTAIKPSIKINFPYAYMEIASSKQNATLRSFDITQVGRAVVRCKFGRFCRIPPNEEEVIKNKASEDFLKVLKTGFKNSLKRSIENTPFTFPLN